MESKKKKKKKIDNVVYLAWIRATRGLVGIEQLHEVAEAIQPVYRAE
jgi:hypothetical protein